MGTYVTLQELKDTLGIGNLYADAYLEQVIDTVDDVIDSYLAYNRYPVTHYQVSSNVATVWTGDRHGLVTGQTVTISNVLVALNGSKTVTDFGPNWVKYAATSPDLEYPVHLVPAGTIQGPQNATYSTTPAIREAALALCVDLWQSRVAPGGQAEAVDFTPGPYRLGRGMVQRVLGVLAPYLDTRSLIG